MDLITPDFGLIFWQVMTLLVVLWILAKFAWKPILAVIQKREDSIEAALREAEVAKKLAAQVQAEKEFLAQTAQKEREKIIAEAMAAKNAIIEEAGAEAAKASKKAIEKAHAVITQEKEAAQAALQNEVAILSVKIAEKLLQEELHQPSAQEALVQRLIKESNWN